MSPVWAICTLAGSTPSSSKIFIWSSPVRLAGREWAMIGLPVCLLARAAARWTFSTPGCHAGLVAGALDERRLDLGALDALLDVVHEQLGDLVLAAVHQELRQVVVGVDAGAGHDLEPVSSATRFEKATSRLQEQRARLDHRLDAVADDSLGVRQRGLPLGVLVVGVRPLEAHALVGRAEVLVDQRQAQLARIDRAGDRLHARHERDSMRAERDPRAWRGSCRSRCRPP